MQTNMKITAIETHYRVGTKTRTSAVDWWRVVNPMKHLAINTDWDITIQKGISEKFELEVSEETEQIYSELADKNDLVWMSYMDNGVAQAYLMLMREKRGLEFVVDLDDNLYNITGSNPVSQIYTEDARGVLMYEYLKGLVEDAPNLSVTNSHLKKFYKAKRRQNERADSIGVLPNMIDLDVYKYKREWQDRDTVTIGYHGGQTHFLDFYQPDVWGAITYIMGKYPQVKLKLAGFTGAPTLNWIDESRVTKISGSSDFFDWIEVWKKYVDDVDIAICPIESIPFNESKSPIKYFENAAACIPCVVSDYGPYKLIRDGDTGFRARHIGQWIEKLEALVINKQLRREMGERAYKDVEDNHNIKTGWVKYRDFIETVV